MKLDILQHTAALCLAASMLGGCGAFDIHPYDVDVKGATGINTANIR